MIKTYTVATASIKDFFFPLIKDFFFPLKIKSVSWTRRFGKSCGEKKKKAASCKALCFLGKRNNSKFSHTIVSPMRDGIF